MWSPDKSKSTRFCYTLLYGEWWVSITKSNGCTIVNWLIIATISYCSVWKLVQVRPFVNIWCCLYHRLYPEYVSSSFTVLLCKEWHATQTYKTANYQAALWKPNVINSQTVTCFIAMVTFMISHTCLWLPLNELRGTLGEIRKQKEKLLESATT